MKKIITGMFILFSIMNAASAASGITSWHKITQLDSLATTNMYITLENYTNAACDANRILLEVADDMTRAQMVSMILSAFHAGSEVAFDITELNGQCRSSRVLMRK